MKYKHMEFTNLVGLLLNNTILKDPFLHLSKNNRKRTPSNILAWNTKFHNMVIITYPDKDIWNIT